MSLAIEHVYGLTAPSQAAFQCSGNTVVACSGAGAVQLDPLSGDECSSFYSSAPKPSSRRGPAWDSNSDSPDSPSRTGGSSPKSPSRSQPKANAASCVAVSSRGYVAVGETGYMPRIALYSQDDGKLLTSVRVHQYGVNHLAFNREGNLLVSLGDPNDGYIYVWQVDHRKRQFTQLAANKCISDVKAIQWLSDIQFLTVGVRHVRFWTIPDTDDGDGVLSGRNAVLKEAVEKTFDSICVLNNGRDWVVGTSCGLIYRLVPEVEACAAPGDAVRAIVETLDGNVVVGTSSEIIEYNAQSWNVIRAYSIGCGGLVCTSSGTILAMDASGRSARLLSTTKDEQIPHGVRIRYVEASDDSSKLLWWKPSGSCGLVGEGILKGDSEVSSAASCQGKLVIGTTDGNILWLDDGIASIPQPGVNCCVVKAHSGSVTDIQPIEESMLVTGGRDKYLQIWRGDGNLEQTLAVSSPVLLVVVVTATLIACCTSGKTLHLFRSSGGKSAFGQFKSVSLRAMPLGLTAFKSHVVVSMADKQIVSFDSTTGTITHTLRCADTHGEPLALSHVQIIESDGHAYLIGAGSDKSLMVYTYPQGHLVSSEWGHAEPISGLDWCAASSSIVTAADTIIERQFTPDRRSPSPELSRSSSPVRIRAPIPRTPPGSPPARLIPSSPTRSPSRVVSARSPGQIPSPVRRAPSPIRSRAVEAQRPSIGDRKISLSPIRAPRLVDPVAQLESALVEFNKTSNPRDANKLKPLLIEALNKVDGLALVETFSDKLLAVFEQKLNNSQSMSDANESSDRSFFAS